MKLFSQHDTCTRYRFIGRLRETCRNATSCPNGKPHSPCLRRVRSTQHFAALLLVFALAACDENPPPLPHLGPSDVVLAFGDSLTYGTGAGPGEAYPQVLGQLIGRKVVVAGVLIGVPTPELFGGPPEFYDRIAKEFSLPLEKKILNDVLFDRSLKSDLIHPNAAGYRRLAQALAELLHKAGAV